MKFIGVGINHEFLNINEREVYHFRETDKLAFSTQLLDYKIDQTFILSTCNRSEVYVVCDNCFDEKQLSHLFLDYFNQDNDYIQLWNHQKAIEHLLEVACGLQSMVIGEDQILHQIKDALSWTMEQKFSGKEMNYILQNIIGFAKEMRQKYAMSEHPLSVSYIGYRSLIPYLKKEDKIMICGIGEMAQLMIEYLKDYDLYLVNRSYDHVAHFLNDRRIFVPFKKRYQFLNDVNIVISATSSPHTIFDSSFVHVNHHLLFLDLAIPRDVDLQLKKQNHIKVIDMDDLKDISSLQLQKRQEKCQIIKNECLKQKEKIIQGLQMMKSDDVIQRMQSRYLDISQETFLLLRKKLDLTSKEEKILEKILKTSFLRLMKDPIYLLKNGDIKQQEQYIELVQKILDIKEGDR